jgi:hypothetical protein
MCMPAFAPSPATAQENRPTPSAEQLWEEYPLEPTPEASARPSAGAPDRPARSQTTATGGDGPSILLLIAAGIAAAGAAVLTLRWLRGRAPGAPRGSAALLPGLVIGTPLVSIHAPQGAMPTTERSPRLALAAAGDRHGVRRGGHRASRPAAVAPPDPNLDWNAEIEWHHAAGGSRFRFVASSPSAPEKAALRESEPVQWPPSGPESVVAMRRAVERLQAAAVEAGWQPAPSGRAWYSRRFRWEAATQAAAAPAPEARPARTGRFTRTAEWPADTADLPRCEITWDVGYLKSHFRATVFEPGGKRAEAACSSKPFRGYLAGTRDADAEELRSEVKALVDTMTEAGWEPAGRGARWFSFRFVWREGAPDPQPERAGHAAD